MTRHLVTALALLGLLGGCDSEEAQVVDDRRPAEKVNLPPSPEMVEPRFVEKYVDGSYTVAGLIKQRGKEINTEVTVKGYIEKVYRCQDGDDSCTLPMHATLVDDLDRPRKRLLVVGGETSKLNDLEKDAVVTLKGRYQQASPDGRFVRMEGLIVLPHLEPEPEEPADGDSKAAP